VLFIIDPIEPDYFASTVFALGEKIAMVDQEGWDASVDEAPSSARDGLEP
jgi:hypothetical protein